MSREYKAFGVLFPNHKKMGKQPDYKGEIEMGGVKYELAGWIRDSKKGNRYISVVIGDVMEDRPDLPKHPASRNYDYEGPPELPDSLPGMPGKIPF